MIWNREPRYSTEYGQWSQSPRQDSQKAAQGHIRDSDAFAEYLEGQGWEGRGGGEGSTCRAEHALAHYHDESVVGTFFACAVIF